MFIAFIVCILRALSTSRLRECIVLLVCFEQKTNQNGARYYGLFIFFNNNDSVLLLFCLLATIPNLYAIIMITYVLKIQGIDLESKFP